jgi:hypothetical protein
VTVASGHDSRNQRSRCQNPCGHVHRNVGHDPGITGHVGPEYSPKDELIIKAAKILGVSVDDAFIEASRLPPDLQTEVGNVVRMYRKQSQAGK